MTRAWRAEPQDEAASLSVPLLSRQGAKLEGFADSGLQPYLQVSHGSLQGFCSAPQDTHHAWLQEAWLQLALIVPIAGSQIAQYLIILITLAATGKHFPTEALAAVALATVAYSGFCKMLVISCQTGAAAALQRRHLSRLPAAGARAGWSPQHPSQPGAAQEHISCMHAVMPCGSPDSAAHARPWVQSAWTPCQPFSSGVSGSCSSTLCP